MFKGVDPGVFYAAIELTWDQIEKHATDMEFPVKLNGLSASVAFKSEWKDKVLPFKSKDIQTIIMNKFTSTFDIKNLME